MALLAVAETPSAALSDRTEDIRQVMLQELGQYGEKKFPAIARRVRFAPDVQGLWYARTDVMAIMANTHGETIARAKMASISRLFNGLVPKSLLGRAGLRAR